MRTSTINQIVIIEAAPSEVYEAWMDSERHSQFTGRLANISREIGGSFTAMDSLRGNNVELVPGKKIVQTWQCDYDGWPSDHFSVLTIQLSPIAGGTALEFEQTGVPLACLKGIHDAWHKHYWLPLKRMFQEEAAAHHGVTA
jgi:uncharacterized protein YndB with AHSA1/START domain